MARQKKPVHRVQMTEGKRNIIHQLLEEYDIQSAEDIQDALNQNVRIMMITAMGISANRSTADMDRWKSKCRRTENQHLNHRW